jgi:DNA polymerase III subunit delta'
MALSEIIGHEKQLETLRSALTQGRLHHAYLFVGPEGVGKRTVALSLARALHCSDQPGDFCGQCANCARIQAGNHPDVRVIGPLPDKKEISIQQIREIEKELNFRSFSGGRKIAIIDPATLMNLAAQNALLKTLEEPPQDSVLILIASNSGGLLPTLRSRCLRLSFSPLRRDLLAGLLAAKGMNPETANFLAAISGGSPGVAMNIDIEELREKRQLWSGMLSALKTGGYRAATEAAEALASNKEETSKFLQWAETWYRDLLIHTVTQNSGDIVNLDQLAQIEEHAAHGEVEHLLSLLAQTSAAGAQIQRNFNRRMVLEGLFFAVVGAR